MIEQIRATKKKVKEFGFLFGGLAIALAGYMAFRGNPAWPWVAAAGALFAVAGAAAYPLMKPVYAAWMLFALALAWVNTRLLLGLFYYCVMTPIGLLLRLSGKDLLGRKFDREAATYWKPRDRAPADRSKLERMF